MQDFRNIIAWQKSHEFVLTVYKLTKDFPSAEQFGVTAQLRRAAISISSNIAEGSCRGSDKDFARFLQMSMGSASEVDYLLELSHDLGYLSEVDYVLASTSISEIKRILASFIRTLTKGVF